MLDQTRKLALELNVIGLVNVQFAVRDDKIYLIEVNPRASRTVPFVSKAVGVPMAKLATKLMLGRRLQEYDLPDLRDLPYVAVKESVLPFHRFPNVDTLLGPEMKSTGEVMGIDRDFSVAFAKASIAAGTLLPTGGNVFLSICDNDKPYLEFLARQLAELGFNTVATAGTAKFLASLGLDVKRVNKVREGRPHIVDMIRSKQIQMVVNTPTGKLPQNDSYLIRRSALEYQVPYFTTVEAADAAIRAIAGIRQNRASVTSVQQWQLRLRADTEAKS